MSVASVTTQGRRAAEARMTSRVTVRRKTGRTTQNETTGREVPEWLTVHTNLPARFPPDRGGGGKSRTFDVGGSEVTVALREMHLPYATTGLVDGDYAVVTTGRAASVVWEIADATPPGDQATAYRLDVVAVDSPEEW